MSNQNDTAYYQKRAAEERKMAEAASDLAAQTIHLELARNYDLLAVGGGRDDYLDGEDSAGPTDVDEVSIRLAN